MSPSHCDPRIWPRLPTPACEPKHNPTPKPTPMTVPVPDYPDVPQIDWPAFYGQFPGRPAVIDRLVRTLLANEAATPAHLMAAIAAEDWPAATRLAHSVKGMAAGMMARDLATLAADAEQRARANDPVAAAALTRLAADLQALLDRLTSHFGQPT